MNINDDSRALKPLPRLLLPLLELHLDLSTPLLGLIRGAEVAVRALVALVAARGANREGHTGVATAPAMATAHEIKLILGPEMLLQDALAERKAQQLALFDLNLQGHGRNRHSSHSR